MFTVVLNISNIEDRSYDSLLSFNIYKGFNGQRYITRAVTTVCRIPHENALVYKRPFQSVFYELICLCIHIFL